MAKWCGSYAQVASESQADQHLRELVVSIRELASQLGYLSEDAFKRAFRREVGTAPGSYRRRARAGKAAVM